MMRQTIIVIQHISYLLKHWWHTFGNQSRGSRCKLSASSTTAAPPSPQPILTLPWSPNPAKSRDVLIWLGSSRNNKMASLREASPPAYRPAIYMSLHRLAGRDGSPHFSLTLHSILDALCTQYWVCQSFSYSASLFIQTHKTRFWPDLVRGLGITRW